MKEIYIIDTETTGLNAFPEDFILEIGIIKVDIANKKSYNVFSSCINWYSLLEENNIEFRKNKELLENKIKNSWILENSTLTLDEIKNAPGVYEIVNIVSKILDDKIVTSYNTEFDFHKFLNKEPFLLDEIYREKFPCLMLASTPVCKIPGYYNNSYKFPRLEEAYNILVNEPIPAYIPLHRALSDAWLASKVLLALYPKYYPKIPGW